MARSPIRLGVVGAGKIARDQHVRAIADGPDFVLAASADPVAGLPGVPAYRSLRGMLAGEPEIAPVAICTPPASRHAAAAEALRAGKLVLLEKPPGATLGEVEDLGRLASESGLTLFAAWRSQYAAGVEPARAWLAARTIRSVVVTWREDVRRWRPGQDWIWRPGGMGVFDPGINALSILTKILPSPLHLRGAALQIPSNCATPIAAQLLFGGHEGEVAKADFDFRQTGPQTWRIQVETADGELLLTDGGARLAIAGQAQPVEDAAEYRGIYRRFGELVARGACEVDVAPLRHVADAFMIGRRLEVEAFVE